MSEVRLSAVRQCRSRRCTFRSLYCAGAAACGTRAFSESKRTLAFSIKFFPNKLCLAMPVAVPAQAMHGASPVPRCLVFRSRLMRHADLGARLFLLGNLFRRPPAGASPSLPPCRLVERLETEVPSEPAACPAPALESRRVGCPAACAGHLLWARGARYGIRSAFVSRVSSEE
jgi:hypothetical protein